MGNNEQEQDSFECDQKDSHRIKTFPLLSHT